MSDEEMRIAIAEVCGWTEIDFNPLDGWFGYEPNGIPNGSKVKVPLPDYLNDLNAMQEAEKVLEFDTYLRFVVNLCNVCGWRINHADDTIYVGNMYRMLQATARQRAVAFLKTLNLYKA